MLDFNPYILFLLGSVFLYYSSEILVSNSILLSKKFNIPRIVIGGTIIALGTSLPEIVVSVLANIKKSNNIAIGNIIGSNIANIGLVFGVSILFKSINIKNNDKKINYNIYSLLLFTFIFFLLIQTGNINYKYSVLFILLYFLLFYLMFKYLRNDKDISSENRAISNHVLFLKLIFGIILIYFGSNFFVDGAIGISKIWGVYDLAIGMTIVAFGTSAPELIASINAMKRNEHMLVVGNIIGSNIANIVFAAGISGLIQTIYFDYNDLMIYNYIMLLFTMIFVFMIYILNNIRSVYGLLFISIYFIFIYLNFYGN